jgi:hypothetical protein
MGRPVLAERQLLQPAYHVRMPADEVVCSGEILAQPEQRPLVGGEVAAALHQQFLVSQAVPYMVGEAAIRRRCLCVRCGVDQVW